MNVNYFSGAILAGFAVVRLTQHHWLSAVLAASAATAAFLNARIHDEDMLKAAEGIARLAHAGQREESTGDDYILHVMRVVNLVHGAEAKAVAWLHDVLEDSEFTSADLADAGIPARLIRAVLLLTRVPWETSDADYARYIETIRAGGDDLARRVKIADLADHLYLIDGGERNCPERLRPKYRAALAVLNGRTEVK